MAKKVLTEAEMRAYVEGEVRKGLLKENITDEGLASGLLGLLPYIKHVGGIQNLSLVSILGAWIGNWLGGMTINGILGLLGIRPRGKIWDFITGALGSLGGAYLGDLFTTEELISWIQSALHSIF